MSRPAVRKSFRVECLEDRQLLAQGGPSAEAQYMLEELNLARTNPSAAAQHFTTNLSEDVKATLKYYNVDLNGVRNELASAQPRPALAWNDQLAAAAVGQSQDQANTGVQSHTGSDGSSTGQRMDRVGYTGRVSGGENAYAYSSSVDHAMEAFLIDWGVNSNGHRNNILQPNATDSQVYREVGIGIVATNKANIGPKVITQDFGTRANALPELLGVAYNDPNHVSHYTMGSGVGNVQVSATNLATGQSKGVLTWDNGGGYQMELPAGSYQVTAKVGNQVISSQQVNIGGQNVKVDYNLSDAPKAAPAPEAKPQTVAIAPVTAAFKTTSEPAPSTPPPVVVAPAVVTPKASPTPTEGSWMSTWNSWTARKSR